MFCYALLKIHRIKYGNRNLRVHQPGGNSPEQWEARRLTELSVSLLVDPVFDCVGKLVYLDQHTKKRMVNEVHFRTSHASGMA